MDWYPFQFDIHFIGVSLIRLLAACILGGIIGFERQYSRNTPAGFRTHILVSLGSCLAMLISQFTFLAYQGIAGVDPTRIGAQVLSGIGFLGAGAIIRHGYSVKGITTSASIWAVACVGLACGIGYFVGAILSTILIYAVLIYLKMLEGKLSNRNRLRTVEIEAASDLRVLSSLNELFKEFEIGIKSMEVSEDPADQKLKILCQLEVNKNDLDFCSITAKIKEIDSVLKVSV